MKKLVILVAMLTLASVAFAQGGLSYVPSTYTSPITPRGVQDTKLGMHDVKLSPAGNGSVETVADYAGCQSCHVPHEAQAEEYIWKWTLPTNIVGNQTADASGIALNAASFHTLACMSCHDGATATDVYANLPGGTFPTWANVAGDAEGLMNDHPVNAMLAQHGATAPPRQYVRFYTPDGVTLTVNTNPDGTTASGTQFGYVECGSCHDPHKGDGATYAFLRGPVGGTTPQYARLDFCRNCHGK